MSRVSLKIVGASGQGINSIGEILAKGLKRDGYCVFGYREYPSLIKGGHASYQLDVSDRLVGSSEERVDILVSLNHHGLQLSLPDLKEGGILVHSITGWKFSEEQQKLITDRRLRVVTLPVEAMLGKMGAKPILGNVVIASFLWAALGRQVASLTDLVCERFAKKPQLLELNRRCVEEGYRYTDPASGAVAVAMPPASDVWKKQMLITGGQALGLGAIRAGARFFAGYPMTPSTPLLSFIGDMQNRSGMAVKQAEDEITAVQMISGAMHAGTRAFTATSGGGFDLMGETLSMNGIMENPAVVVLAQRPGPGTGLPTWTAQADLHMAIGTAHGEFPRCVIGVSGSEDGFFLMAESFNLAEEFQVPVIVLTDKQLMEGLYTQELPKQSAVELRRGKLVTKPVKLQKLSSKDRYDPSAADGVSQRWLPGTKAPTYCAQADEHTPDGSTSESGENAKQQIDKRLRKHAALLEALPEPELLGAQKPELLLVGWGSTKTAVLDALSSEKLKGKSVGYLHYTYLWPLRTRRLVKLASEVKDIVLVEGNALGQLGKLIRQECGVDISRRILKYDGRPFFFGELVRQIEEALTSLSRPA